MTKKKKSVVTGFSLFIVALLIVVLAACSPTNTAVVHSLKVDITEHYQLPPELKECKVFRLAPNTSPGAGNMPWLYVVKCEGHTETQWKQGTFPMQVSST